MTEKTFRAALLRELRACGCVAVPIESAVTPGFPDAVVAKCQTALVECKAIPTGWSLRPLARLFEKSQLAFYKTWWRTSAANLWLAVYDRRAKTAAAFRLHPDHLALPLCEVLGHHFSGTVKAAARLIGGSL